MDFQREINDDIVVEVVNLTRATFREADDFRKILFKDIDGGWKKIVVDLEGCKFMDSTFLGTLVSGLKHLSDRQGEMKLATVHSDTKVILEITGTDRIFDLCISRQEAIESFKKGI